MNEDKFSVCLKKYPKICLSSWKAVWKVWNEPGRYRFQQPLASSRTVSIKTTPSPPASVGRKGTECCTLLADRDRGRKSDCFKRRPSTALCDV
jgi:hypothetical protein